MSGPFWCRCLPGTHGFGPQASRRIAAQADRPRRTARTRLYLEPTSRRDWCPARSPSRVRASPRTVQLTLPRPYST